MFFEGWGMAQLTIPLSLATI